MAGTLHISKAIREILIIGNLTSLNALGRVPRVPPISPALKPQRALISITIAKSTNNNIKVDRARRWAKMY